MIRTRQEFCASRVSVVAGTAAREVVDHAVVGDARTVQAVATDVAPTRSGAQDAAALVPTWQAA